MRIRHFNTDLKGGAATSARRLHHALLAQNIESLFHYHPDHHDDQATAENKNSFQSMAPVERTGLASFFKKRRLKQTYSDYRRHFDSRPADREIYSIPWQADQTPFGNACPCDVVHLHWVSSWLDLKSFFRSLPKRQPIVWSLHDMNAITGLCHHADECENFKTCCRSCPQIDNPGANDISSRCFKYKKNLYQNLNLHFVTPSRWMEGNVRASALGQFASSVRTIRNPLDLNHFQPFEKNETRSSFGIPLDRPVIGFGAGSLSNNRKGFQDLLKALQLIASERTATEFSVLVFGVDDIELPSIPGVEFFSLGFLATQVQQRKVYSAMDLFVLPSWAETISQTGPEAMACNTPVVAYDIGGIPEIVIPNQTGLLAKHRDPADLARMIKSAIKNPEQLIDWGKNGQKLIRDQFSMDESRTQHLELYRSIS